MSRKLKMFLLAAMLVFGFAHAAYADLAAVGPTDVATGFPTFYQDNVGLQLGPCDVVNFDPILGVNNPPCPGLALTNPVGDFVVGNIEEVSFYRTEANIGPLVTGELFRLRIEVQGGVLPPESVNNAVRLRLRSLVVPGDYTIQATPPFFLTDFVVNVPDPGVGNPIPDVDVELPGGALAIAPLFSLALPGNVQTFIGNGTGALVPPVLGTFIGDGLTPAPMDNAAVFRVIGPPGSGIDVTEPNWVVEGKVAGQVVVLTVNSATFKRGAVPGIQGGHVDVIATSDPLATVTVDGLTPLPVAMVGNGAGQFFAHIPVADPTLLPATVAVTATLAGVPPVVTTVNQPLVDVVTITKAEYNAFLQTLDIEAKSSDLFGAPTLTAFNANTGANLGALVGGVLSVPLVAAPPDRVRVTSSAGGVARTDVTVTTLRLRLVDFIQSTSTWDLRGNSSMPIGTPVNTFLTRTGELIGSRNVRQNAANGQWVINIAGSLVVPQPGDTVTFESAGDQVIFPVRILP